MPGENGSIIICNPVKPTHSVGQEDVFDVREHDLDRLFV